MTDTLQENEKIGQLLLREGLISDEELSSILTYQARQSKYRPIGQILTHCGFVTKERLRDALLAHKKQVMIGMILVRMGIITENQLVQALRAQLSSKKKIGQILLELNFVTRAQLVDALYLQLDFVAIELGTDLPDKDLFSKVNIAFLRNKRVVPLCYDQVQRTLSVLMEDPSDKETVYDLEKVFGTKIEPLALHNNPIESLLDRLLDIWHTPV
jgi:type IV pilus assembly protein PilB